MDGNIKSGLSNLKAANIKLIKGVNVFSSINFGKKLADLIGVQRLKINGSINDQLNARRFSTGVSL